MTLLKPGWPDTERVSQDPTHTRTQQTPDGLYEYALLGALTRQAVITCCQALTLALLPQSLLTNVMC